MFEQTDWNKYIGIPYAHRGRDLEKGLDCLGLVIYFYKNEAGFILPQFGDLDSSIHPKQLHDYIISTDYNPEHYLTKQESPLPGDTIMFRIMNHPIHVGIYMDNNKFLHTSESTGRSLLGDFRKWSNRIDGYYRITHNQ